MRAMISSTLSGRRSEDFSFLPLSFTRGGLLGNRRPGPNIPEPASADFVTAAHMGGCLFSRANFSAAYLEAEKETALNIFTGQELPIIPLFSFLGNMPTFGAAGIVKGSGPHPHGEGFFHCRADDKGDGLSTILAFLHQPIVERRGSTEVPHIHTVCRIAEYCADIIRVNAACPAV